MRNSIILPPSRILSGEMTAFIDVVKPQPKLSNAIQVAGTTSWNIFDGVSPITAPYHIGQILAVRESWLELDRSHFITGRYAYKADSCAISEAARMDYVKCGYPYKWRSPATMPLTAARLHIEITGVMVVRVQDTTRYQRQSMGYDLDWYVPIESMKRRILRAELDSLKAGHARAFQNSFTAKHGLPAWNENFFVFFYEFKMHQK